LSPPIVCFSPISAPRARSYKREGAVTEQLLAHLLHIPYLQTFYANSLFVYRVDAKALVFRDGALVPQLEAPDARS
jgi:hypothetical protein